MKSTLLPRAAAAALVLLVSACASTPGDSILPDNPFKTKAMAAREEHVTEEQLYKAARKALDNSDFSSAIKRYDELITRFPFGEYGMQAEMERVYAYYRSYQPDQAITAADRFLRDHPRHPHADYVQYLKGLIDSNRDEGLGGFLGLDTTKEDIGYSRNAFDSFAVLVQKYPDSRYAGDARQRMIYLRNRIAEHELHIARFYVKRGAYVAAARRASEIVTQYPGAPAGLDALAMLEDCDRELGLSQQADDARSMLLALEAAPPQISDYPAYVKHRGFFARLIEGHAPGATPPQPAEPTPGNATLPAAAEPSAQPFVPDSQPQVAAPDASGKHHWWQRILHPFGGPADTPPQPKGASGDTGVPAQPEAPAQISP